MERRKVESTMISEVGYDPAAREMEVVFTNGHIYRYQEVPQDVYEDLLAAESKGKFMHDAVLGAYPETRITRARH